MALLKGDTRALAQKGLAALRETKRLGLQVIMDMAGVKPETVNEETIGFTFAPRLNAIGRLGDANPAVELLTTEDSVRARVLAAQLEGLNSQRRLLTSQVYRAAEAQLREDPSLLEQPAIVLGHPSWPGGVVGIVASRLKDRYNKPVILLNTAEGEPARGSARSIEGLHITEAIAAQKDLLLGFRRASHGSGHVLGTGKPVRLSQRTEQNHRACWEMLSTKNQPYRLTPGFHWMNSHSIWLMKSNAFLLLAQAIRP